MNHIFLLNISLARMNLINKFTSKFLLLSWEELKYKYLLYARGNDSFLVRPPSKNWFIKVSYFIRCGKLSYKSFGLKSKVKITIRSVKASIINYSFFLLIKPFFDEYLFFNKFYFMEYL